MTLLRDKFRAVLFDKDGVLIDSLNTCFLAFNETLRHYGKSELKKEEYLRGFWGTKAEINLDKIFINLTEIERKEIVDYYMRRRMELGNLTKLYTKVIPILEALKRKYKLALVTNTLREMAVKLLLNFEILRYFDVVVGGDEGKPKPAPDLILRACRMLGVHSEESIFVGDTLVDIKAGKEAGCKTIIVSTSIPRRELEKIESIGVIYNLEELLKLLN
jgi:HAD superfamily hydrolase (TIGR01509 family)